MRRHRFRLLAVWLLGITATGNDARMTAEPVPAPLTAEQRRDLEKQAAEREKAAADALAAEDFTTARQQWREVEALRTTLHGAADCRVTDARLAGAHVEKIAGLNAEQRQRLREAEQANSQGTQSHQKGQYHEALAFLQKALTIRGELLGEEDLATAVSYTNVAACVNAQGKHADAERLLRKALAIRQRVLGEDHPETALSYGNLASNLYDQGRYADADPLYRQALAIRQRALGEQHPETALGYNNLAANLHEQGNYPDAERLYRQALSIRRQTLGEQHPDTAQSYNNVARILLAQGKYTDAQRLFRQALAIRQKALGEQHPDTTQSYNNVAAILNTQGKYAEAEPLFCKSLALRQTVVGEDHPDMATACNNLANNLQAQGKYADAEPLFRRALAVWQKTLGEEHSTTALGLGRPLGKAAALAEAKRWLSQLEVAEATRLVQELPVGSRGTEVSRAAPLVHGRPFAHPYYWASFILIGEPGDLSAAVAVFPAAPEPVGPVAGRMSWWCAAGGTVSLLVIGLIWRRRSRARDGR